LLPTAVKTNIGEPFIQLSSVDSTNIYAMQQVQANLAAHGTVFFADEQTNGKGQMGKSWEGKAGQNIALSAILDCSFLSISHQFYLSMAVALACFDCLSQFLPSDWSIKWPNDIYWGDRKAGGILIENSVQGSLWQWAIVGIGLNINQTEFGELGKKAVSLKQVTGKEWDRLFIAQQLCNHLEIRFQQLRNKQFHLILQEYQIHLYKLNQLVRLKKGAMVGEYKIKSVNAKGELIAEKGIDFHFPHGSVEWVSAV
jgi:BirA family transcriptional regulator, biotin operon repressor / biotin---[acetyl-CoA-carboxylase] ligase